MESSNVSKLESLGKINGEEVDVYQILNGSQTSAIVTSYGATLLSLKISGKEVTLCWSDLADL